MRLITPPRDVKLNRNVLFAACAIISFTSYQLIFLFSGVTLEQCQYEFWYPEPGGVTTPYGLVSVILCLMGSWAVAESVAHLLRHPQTTLAVTCYFAGLFVLGFWLFQMHEMWMGFEYEKGYISLDEYLEGRGYRAYFAPARYTETAFFEYDGPACQRI